MKKKYLLIVILVIILLVLAGLLSIDIPAPTATITENYELDIQ